MEGMELHCRVNGIRIKEDMVLLRKETVKSYTYVYQAEGLVPDIIIQNQAHVCFSDMGFFLSIYC